MNILETDMLEAEMELLRRNIDESFAEAELASEQKDYAVEEEEKFSEEDEAEKEKRNERKRLMQRERRLLLKERARKRDIERQEFVKKRQKARMEKEVSNLFVCFFIISY